ncbi:hypothetical protein H257_06842 [Aphanomyces astaci]|uniref:Uncharacterized protein n=1 Tax=Aphanomyces astaci TaxID=112090 RepID=W4GL20_APHAT|nr:hypothetical protein H257_06842 [Aphanomyces astaci]ETV79583.1 hypothetical protein H257_06842 [Aphanomyces astaci]RQM22630.1 hypothetical protein B5M09_003358 [Aphanomyces astaci]|eukprot:XP_009830519.1 hypothetical protein H257_06842 [Aphanomyces astaci]
MGENKGNKAAQREKLLASKRAWAKEHYEQNRERILAVNKKWALKNRAKIRESKRRYRERNRAKHRNQIQAYYRNWKRRRDERRENGEASAEDDDPEPPQDLDDDDDLEGEGWDRDVDYKDIVSMLDNEDLVAATDPTVEESERYTPRQRSMVLVRQQKFWQRLADVLPMTTHDLEHWSVELHAGIPSSSPPVHRDYFDGRPHVVTEDAAQGDVASEDEEMYARAHEMTIVRRRKKIPSTDEQLEQLKQDPSMAAVLETIILMRAGSGVWPDDLR